jgi:hypothetical protein
MLWAHGAAELNCADGGVAQEAVNASFQLRVLNC